jgi:hypothetical protein
MLTSVMQKIQTVFVNQDSPQSLGWMDTLTGMSELDALTEIKNKLAEIEFLDAVNLKNKIELVLEIDRKTYRSVKKITHNYLISLKNNRGLEAEIQNAVYTYQRQLYMAYTQFFEFYQIQSKVKLSLEKINLILARLLNATFIMAKWRYFDDQPAPLGTWDNVHKIIKYAENLAIINTNLFLYDFQIKETSIATILKRGFMMDTLQKGNFSRLQIQLTEQVLKIWATNPLIVNKYKENRYQFFIMLQNDHGPERIRAVEKFAECRYWKTTRLVDLIEAYLCAIDTQKSLAEFGLEKTAPPSVMLKLFKKLRTEWCVEGYARQRRRENRNKNYKLLNVSNGLYEICHRLAALQAKNAQIQPEDGNFSFDLKVATYRRGQLVAPKSSNTVGKENWWLVDESGSGFAVDLGKELSGWVETGVLVGYTTPDEKDLFSVAEIKSVRKQADGTYRAGLALITQDATPLQISRMQQGAISESLTGYYVDDAEINLTHLSTFSGLYLKATDASKASLLIPRPEFKRGTHYRINIEGEDRLVLINRVIAKQRDWIRVEVPD